MYHISSAPPSGIWSGICRVYCVYNRCLHGGQMLRRPHADYAPRSGLDCCNSKSHHCVPSEGLLSLVTGGASAASYGL